MNVLSTVTALAVAVVSTAIPSTVAGADAAPLFNGSYTVTQKAQTDPASGAGLPDRTSTWIVSSACALLGCLAAVVSDSLTSFNLMFDGTKWTRLSTGDTGTCGGVTVPASAAALFVVPQGDGSFTGVRTVTVPCGGTSADLSQPLTVTPVKA
jgi:hypothetical protein